MSLMQQLMQDLAILGTEAKRRNPEIRHASDKSIELIKTSAVSSNLKEFIKAHPDFINPFLLSCQSRNAKLTAIAIQWISKFAMLNVLPVSKLDLIVDSLLESTHSTTDIQLKILQILPVFYQNNSGHLKGDVLSRFLFICSSLQGSNKTVSVMNAASATFLQLVNLVFEMINVEDNEGITKFVEVEIDDSEKIEIGEHSYDARRILNDLCTLIEHHKPAFLKTNYATEDFGFELLESLIKNSKEIFLKHVELAYLLRTRVAPIALRFLSSSKDYTIMVRVAKLILLLIQDQFDVLKLETEVTLSLLTHTISPESASPKWKRILALEIYNLILKDIEVVRNIFQEYDNNTDDKKNVLADFLKTCILVVREHSSLLGTGSVVQLPIQNLSENGSESSLSSSVFSVASSSIRVPYIELLDKSDPPPTPETYMSYLVIDTIIKLCESACTYGLELSYVFSEQHGESGISFLNKDSFNKLPQKYYFEFITDLIAKNWKNILQLFSMFIYSTLDNDMFTKVLRGLQKLCHTSGVLGLEDPTREILVFFAKCTLMLDTKSMIRQKTFSISESIVGTISSTLSSISTTAATDTTAPEKPQSLPLHPRSLNSRNVTCFRVLMSLAGSLAEILESNWRTILITLQWMSYYVDGTSGISAKEVPYVSGYLKNQDLASIEQSLKKLLESIKSQESNVFSAIINAGTQLLSEVKAIPQNDLITGRVPIDNNESLQVCAFNIFFYLDYITELCQLNPIDFLLEDPKNTLTINKFYIDLATNRELDDDFRLYSSRNFNAACKSMGIAGFERCSSVKDDEDLYKHMCLITENQTFSSLNKLMTALSKLPTSGDVTLSNVEVEMYLQSLNCLQGLVNRFGTLIKKHWDIVFNMVSLPLEIIYSSNDMNKEKQLREIVVSVLRSSFETVKVVLDEMLQSIPSDQIKIIIDCLFKFVFQKFDLNISLNSISYFWLISDYTKEKILPQGKSSMNEIENIIDTQEDLKEIVADMGKSYSTEDNNRLLWTYLILQLAKLSHDERTQVRNGSLMTFFNVADSHIDLGESWKLIYYIIVEPIIMNIRPTEPFEQLEDSTRKDWIDSLSHVVSGLTKLFMNFLGGDNSKIGINAVYWKGLIDYYKKMNLLASNYSELDLCVHKSYTILVDNFSKDETKISEIPSDIIDDLYHFWTDIPISYNLSSASLYQECISAHTNSFGGLFKLVRPSMTLEKYERLLMIFNSSVRYPVLPAGQLDVVKSTELQHSIIHNLSNFQIDGDPRYTSLLIQELALIVGLPFSTRDIIEKKLGNKGLRIPTFLSVSYEALELIEKIVEKTENISQLMNDGCIIKIYKALLECSKVKVENKLGKGRVQLWMLSMSVLVKLTDKVVQTLKENDSDDLTIKSKAKANTWPFIIETLKTTLVYTNPRQDLEEFDLKSYNSLKSIIIHNLNLKSVDNAVIDELVSTIWTNSFLYALDDLENEIISSVSSPLELSKSLVNFEVNSMYGSIENIQQLSRSQTARECLKDLIMFVSTLVGSSLDDDSEQSHIILLKRAMPYLTSRVAFVLRKFLADVRLLNKQPLPRVQQVELMAVLEGLDKTLSQLDRYPKEVSSLIISNLTLLSPLLTKCLAISSKVNDISGHLSDICIKLNSF